MEQYIKLFPFHSYYNTTLNDAACVLWKTKIYPRLLEILFLNLSTSRNRSEAVVFCRAILLSGFLKWCSKLFYKTLVPPYFQHECICLPSILRSLLVFCCPLAMNCYLWQSMAVSGRKCETSKHFFPLSPSLFTFFRTGMTRICSI